MNSSSLLRPAVGYDKIKKRKARDARLTQKSQLFITNSRHYCSNGGYFLPLKIV